MPDPKNNLILAAAGGSLAMILTYAVTFMTAGEGDFWIALILGALVMLGGYLVLFFHGLRFAAALDRYEKDAPAYGYKAPALVRGADGLHKNAMVYFFPERLTMVFRKGRECVTLSVEKRDVAQVLPGKEDTELILRGARTIFSFDWGEEEEGCKRLLSWAERNMVNEKDSQETAQKT